MRLNLSKLKEASPLNSRSLQLSVGWNSLKLRRSHLPRWLLPPLRIPAIPLLLLFALILLLLLLTLCLLAIPVLYLLFLRPSLRSRKSIADKTLEVEYWVEKED